MRLRAVNSRKAPPYRVTSAQRNAPTDLGALLAAGAHMMRRRSLVFVVSDFYSLPGWEARLGQLAQRHEVVAVRLHDPL